MNETQQLEAYLNGKMSPENKLIMEAHLLLNEHLKENQLFQKKRKHFKILISQSERSF